MLFSTVARCMTPPTPPDEQNLILVWNPDFPPIVGEKVKYSCNAKGKFNRWETDIGLSDYFLECLDGGGFEAPDW